IADAEIERSHMHIHCGTADEGRQDAVVESERTRLLRAEALSGLRTHRSQFILLRAHKFLWTDLYVADRDQIACAIAAEPTGWKPNDEARDQREDKACADNASCCLT